MSTPRPAGWYPDGDNYGQQRWWDGNQWTAHVQSAYQAGGSAQELRAPEGTSPDTLQIWLIVALFALPQLTAIVWLANFDWSGYTRSTLDSVYGESLEIYGYLFGPWYIATIATGLLGYIVTAILAYFDGRALIARGALRPFHWALSLIPSYGSMIYIIGRSVVVRRRTGRGLAPVWVLILIVVLSIIGSIAAVVAGLGNTMNSLYPGY